MPQTKNDESIPLAMNCEGNDFIISQELPVTSTQLLYPVLCLICILLFVQRIKHRRSWPALSRRQMHSQKSLPETPPGGNKEKTTGTAAAVDQQQQTMSNSPSKDLSCDVRAPLPSACDILQPLSQYTPLPSSGHLAAMLSQERQGGNRPSLTMEPETPMESSCPEFSSTHAAPGGSIHASGLHQRADQEAVRSPNKGFSLESPQSSAFLPPSSRLTGISLSGIGHLGPESNMVYTVQKRSETVQHLRGADEIGVRTWRRLVVEYS